MDQYSPEEIAEAEAFRERVRRMPGIVMHDNPERVHFVPEIWVEGLVDIDDLLRYDDEDIDDNDAHAEHRGHRVDS